MANIAALDSDGSTDCNRRVLNSIQQAVNSAQPDSVITVFVASGDSDLANNSNLVNNIINTAAVQKRLTVTISFTCGGIVTS